MKPAFEVMVQHTNLEKENDAVRERLEEAKLNGGGPYHAALTVVSNKHLEYPFRPANLSLQT